MRQECIDAVSLAAGRSITQQEAKDIEDRIRNAMTRIARSNIEDWRAMTTAQRMQSAAELAGQELVLEASKRKQRVALTIVAHDRVSGAYGRYIAEGDKPFKAVSKILEQTYAKTKGVANEYFSDLVDTINAVEPRFFGLIEDAKNAAGFVREIFEPGSTGNAAMRNAAKVWMDTAESMRLRFNAAGGDVGKLDYGYIPQSHDAIRLITAGAEKWIKETMPLLDRSRYVDENGARLGDGEITNILARAYETISSEGSNKIEPGTMTRSSFASRHADSRVLHFAGPEAFIQYQAAYGKGSIFSTMQGHVAALARDIALLEELGPNPRVQFSWLQDMATKAGDTDRFGLVKSEWQVLSGETNHPVDVKLAEVMQAARNLASHAKLGFALVSSLNDFPTYFRTTGFNRIPFADSLFNLIRAFGPEAKDYANRAGLVAESIISDMNRWAEGNVGQGLTGKLANATMKASLLEGWTDAIRRALSITMMGAYGKLSRGDWRALDPVDRFHLESKGVTETDFRVWKLAAPEDWKGTKMLTKDSIRSISDSALEQAGLTAMDRNRALSRLLGALIDESEYASLGQDLRTRAITSGGLQKGTMAGEVWRSIMLFKGFPIAMISRHWGRVADTWASGQHGSAVAYTAGLITQLTIFGALSLQLKDIINGKDPREMDPMEKHGGKFWIASAAQGGGFGFAGDLLYQAMGGQKSQSGVPTSVNVASSILGPVFGSALELGDVTLGNIGRAASGHDVHAGADAIRWARGNIPGAGFVNLWYAKAAIDHAVLNDLQEFLSPGYLSRMQERAHSDWGQNYWWKPNEVMPSRAPDMSKAVGG